MQEAKGRSWCPECYAFVDEKEHDRAAAKNPAVGHPFSEWIDQGIVDRLKAEGASEEREACSLEIEQHIGDLPVGRAAIRLIRARGQQPKEATDESTR